MTSIVLSVPGVADRAYFDPRLETWGASKLAPHRGRRRTQGSGYRIEYVVPEAIAREVLPDLLDVIASLVDDPGSRAEARALRPLAERIEGVLRFLDGARAERSDRPNT